LYNLLVKYSEWEGGRETMLLSRLFECAEDSIAALFKDDNSVLLDELIQLPCIFMREGEGDELARVGTITRARIVGNEVAFDYTFELDILPLLLISQEYT